MISMNKTLIWFGDSYTVGSELGYHYGKFTDHQLDDKILSIGWLDRERNRPDLAFPYLTTKKLGLNFLLYGNNAESISGMNLRLIDFIKNHKRDSHSYAAIFALPTRFSRCDYIDDNGNWVHGPDKRILRHQLRFGRNEATLTVNSLYTTCVANEIIPYFLCTWSKLDIDPNFKLVPEDAWLIEPDTTLVEKAWGFTDPPETWRTFFKSNQSVYKQYIKPCGNHPNILGQQMLSNSLYEILKNKLK